FAALPASGAPDSAARIAVARESLSPAAGARAARSGTRRHGGASPGSPGVKQHSAPQERTAKRAHAGAVRLRRGARLLRQPRLRRGVGPAGGTAAHAPRLLTDRD